MGEQKEPFVSSEDRPSVTLKPDTPISELRVRDLQTLIHGVVASKQVAKDWIKDNVHKEYLEKVQFDWIDPKLSEGDPFARRGDTRIDEVIRSLSSLREEVASLNQQLDQVKRQGNEH
jgi:hypothetical protein